MVLSTAHPWRHAGVFVAEERLAPKRPRPTVYLDTTIPSYLTATMSADIAKARMQRITRIWWSRYRPNCEDAARKRVAALESIDAVCLVERSEDLLISLLADGLLPEKARTDAEHIAYAATNSVRFLLTWNCKHLANRMILRRVTQRCESHGFPCPQICTPETMMRVYAYERSTY